jgi:hypothetical protein
MGKVMEKPHRYAIMVLEMTNEFKWRTIKMVVGLGNPGADFAGTFHNAGRDALP